MEPEVTEGLVGVVSPPESILKEAHRIINGDRQNSYGPPERSLERIASLWSAYLNGKYDVSFELESKDAGLMMVLLKIAREQHAENRDNLVDAAGYLALVAGDVR